MNNYYDIKDMAKFNNKLYFVNLVNRETGKEYLMNKEASKRSRKQDRVFRVRINCSYVVSFEPYWENNDAKLRFETSSNIDDALLMDWFDLQFFISNYTHANNWTNVILHIEKLEEK